MAQCVNINSKEFVRLAMDTGLNPTILAAKVGVWQNKNGLDKFPKIEDLTIKENIVSYNLKALKILNSDKAIREFGKGEKNGWDLNKILIELQIPKEQKEIILDKSITNREEIITSLLAENSFVVEVNTAKDKQNTNQNALRFNNEEDGNYSESFDYNNDAYAHFNYAPEFQGDEGYISYTKNGENITKEEYAKARDNNFNKTLETPSQHHSQLTAPGGINYTENEIATPDIIPNIKGHAAFSTDNGIGWFRSDEQDKSQKQRDDEFKKQGFVKLSVDSSKIRRILEIQSDLFQQGRDKKQLVDIGNDKISEEEQWNIYFNVAFDYNLKPGSKEHELKVKELELKKEKNFKKFITSRNQFLQILNKKGNWVNFFIEAIIQDSVKKGYEKVLFPKGDTVAKIEGLTTLEQFKKQKEDRIKWLEENKKPKTWIISEKGDEFGALDKEFKSLKEANNFKDSSVNKENLEIREVFRDNDKEIKTLKQELADVESGQTQLSSVTNFYETTITNILNKKYDNVKEITDEYGNTWNEVDITNEKNTSEIIQLSKTEVRHLDSLPLEKGFEKFYGKLSSFELNDKYTDALDKGETDTIATTEEKIARMQEVFDAVVLIDTEMEESGKLLGTNNPISQRNGGKPVIVINPNKLFKDTVFHEFGHLYIDLLGGMSDSTVLNAIELLKGSALWFRVQDAYPELNATDLAKEVLATALGIEGNTLFEGNLKKKSLWEKIKAYILNAVSKILKKDINALEKLATEMLTNTVRIKEGATFNSTIDQKRKSSITGKVTLKKIQKKFDELTKRFTIEETEVDGRFYDDALTGEKHTRSVSAFAKAMTGGYSATKGDFNIAFDKGWELTDDNYQIVIGSARIPMALDRAMDEFFSMELVDYTGVSKGDKQPWYSFYKEESRKFEEGGLFDYNKILRENFDVINKRANELQKDANLPLEAGNFIHKALEDYINEDIPFPENIIDPRNKLLNAIKNIVDKGKANGSTFFTEQMLFSETANTPGTADLIEITKDNEFRIYDFKTMGSFFNRFGTKLKTDWEMYIPNGYINQILIYSTILQEMGIQPAENHLNILSIEIDKSEMIPGDTNSDIGISQVRVADIMDMVDKDRTIAGEVRKANAKILGAFRNPKKFKGEDSDLLNEIKDIDALASKLSRAVNDFNRKNPKLGATTTDIKKFKDDIEDLMGKKNKQVILEFILTMRKTLGNLYANSVADQAFLTAEYLKDLETINQLSSFLPDIRSFILSQGTDYMIDETDKDQLLELLLETEQKAQEVIKFQDYKTKEKAVEVIVANSNFMQGLWAEKFEMEFRKNNDRKVTKDEIKSYVAENMKTHKDEIKAKEFKYWTSVFSNGYTDLRYMEYLLADPGMNKSQFIQVAKNVMDKGDMDKRIDIDKSIAELVRWHKELDMPSGDPSKIWGKFIETASYTDEKGKKQSFMHASLISETTSDYREAHLKFKYTEEYYERLIIKAKRDKNEKRYEKLIAHMDVLRESKKETLKGMSQKSRPHPKFAKLSEKDKETLRWIHNKLEKADERLTTRKWSTLTYEVRGQMVYQLPKARKSALEQSYMLDGALKRFKSAIDEFRRPPADEDDMNITDQESGIVDDKFKTGETDIVGNTQYEIPIYYRRQLEDPELQSFDLPTLLAMNEETTIEFFHSNMIEADLFMITQSLKNTKVHKTDQFVNKKVVDKHKGGLDKALKSPTNRVLDGVQASIDNRLYKRSYKGIYSNLNYRFIKGAEVLNKVTSTILLAGNFGSASMTAMQGSLYRMIEGVAREDFGPADVAIGSKKAWRDIHNVLADTQKQFPESKSNLLIRRFGLETQYKALTNKFIQDNFVTKNLDEASIFAITSMAEHIVTSSLMYTLMNNIRVMNDKGEFIDNEGKKVNRKEALTLDEAYTVENGELVLNKNVAYTENNLTVKFKDNLNGEKTVAAVEISNYIRSKYADLYGQYNQDMKSVAEMHIVGKLVFSMKKWIPRGYHRRWRGITVVRNSFDDMRKEVNLEKRFYSQDQKKFQEGYYTTGARYLYTFIKELRAAKFAFAMAFKNTNKQLSTHERANLLRLGAEFGTMATTFVAAFFLKGIALDLGDDDKNTDHIYFMAYLAERIRIESATFIDPTQAMENLENPAASINTLTNLSKLLEQLFLASYDDTLNEFDWNINNEFDRGPRKGEKMIWKRIQNVSPFYTKTSQIMGILTDLFGIDEFENKESIQNSYQWMIK